MDFDAGFLLRVLTAITVLGVFARLWASIRRRLAGAYTRAILEFALFVYVLTYFIGVTAMFIFREAAIDASFVGEMYVPPDLPYWHMWLISLLPLLAALVVGGMATRRSKAQKNTVQVVAKEPDTFLPVALATGAVLVLLVFYLRTGLIQLIGNALDLSYYAAHDLWEQRAAVVSDLNAVSAGLIYGTVPCLAVTLLLYKGEHQLVVRIAAVGAVVLAVLLNLGMFLGGALAAAALIFLWVQAQVRDSKLLTPRRIVLLGVLTLLYLWYQTLKPGMAQASIFTSVIQVFMRMPIAMPYLFDLARTHAVMNASVPLPVALAYYMFPSETVKYNVDEPQPAFVEAWFYWGPIGALALLLVILAGTAIVTSILMKRFGRSAGVVRVGLFYSMFHLLYYFFQVDVYEVFNSSYSVFFPLLVPMAISAVLVFRRTPARGVPMRPSGAPNRFVAGGSWHDLIEP